MILMGIMTTFSGNLLTNQYEMKEILRIKNTSLGWPPKCRQHGIWVSGAQWWVDRWMIFTMANGVEAISLNRNPSTENLMIWWFFFGGKNHQIAKHWEISPIESFFCDLMIFPTEKNQFWLGISWNFPACRTVMTGFGLLVGICPKLNLHPKLLETIGRKIFTPHLCLMGTSEKSSQQLVGVGDNEDFNSWKEVAVLLRMGNHWNLGYQPISAWWFHMSRRSFGTAGSTPFQSMSACCWPPCISSQGTDFQLELSALSWGYP